MGAVLAAAYVAVLLASMDIGFGRDEGYYFKAGELYSAWFDELAAGVRSGEPLRAFRRESVDRHWGYNPEHPAVYKALFGLSWRAFAPMTPPEGAADRTVARWYRAGHPPPPGLGWLRESTAFRLPTAVTAGLLLWLLYLFGTEAWDRRVGLAAAVVMATLPRAFYHAHLAAFDLPVAFWITLTVYTFWRSLTRGWGAAVICGVVWGVSLGVKLNAFFTPGILLLWWVIASRGEWSVQRGGRLGVRLVHPPIPRAFFAMALLGPVLLVALWPRIWFDTVERFGWYVRRHTGHEYYWAYYFGRLLVRPPFPVAFPFVMSLVTVPLTSLGLALGGLLAVARRGFGRGARGAAGLVLLAGLVPFAIIANPSTPVFGGTKHWLPAMPFVALVAGVAFARCCDALTDTVAGLGPRLRAVAAGGLLVLFGAPAALAVAHAHPDEVAYYNELLGGFPGAGAHGMQREFWGSTGGHVLDWLDEDPAGRARTSWHDTNWDSYLLYLRDGRLDPRVRFVNDPKKAKYFLFHWHKEFLELAWEVQDAMKGGVPHHVYARDGLPLLVVYGPPTAGGRGAP